MSNATATQQQPMTITQWIPNPQGGVPDIARKLNIPEMEARGIASRLLAHINSNPDQKWKIEKCTKQSVLECVQTAHDLKLPIDGRRMVHLVPYEIKKRENGRSVGTGRYEAQLQFGRGAYIFIIKREFPGAVVKAELVWPGDTFETWDESGNAQYKHVVADPFRSDYDNVAGAYCYISYVSQGVRFSIVEVVGKAELNIIQSKASDKSKAWQEFKGEMYRKVPVKRAGKYLLEGVDAWSQIEALDNENFDLMQEAAPSDKPKAGGLRDALNQEQQHHQPEAKKEDPHVTDADYEELGAGDGGHGHAEVEGGDDDESAGAVSAGAGDEAADRLHAEHHDSGDHAAAAPAADDAGGGAGEAVSEAQPADAGSQSAAADAPADDSAGADGDGGVADDVWDGRTFIVGGMRQDYNFVSPMQGGIHLKKVMKAKATRAERQYLFDENELMVNAIVKAGHGQLITELHKIITEGKR